MNTLTTDTDNTDTVHQTEDLSLLLVLMDAVPHCQCGVVLACEEQCCDRCSHDGSLFDRERGT